MRESHSSDWTEEKLKNMNVLHVDLSNMDDTTVTQTLKFKQDGTISINTDNTKTITGLKLSESVATVHVDNLPSQSDFIKANEPSVSWFETTRDWSDPMYKCPECGGNVRKELNVVYTSNPPCYKYQCDSCKYTTWHHY